MRLNGTDYGKVSAYLNAGGVVGLPTEGVWGLSCRVDCLSAVERILQIKQRAPSKGLIVLLTDFDQLSDWYACPVHETALTESGRPSTWVIPVNASCPTILTGGRTSLAVRRVRMSLLKRIVDRVGPIVSTSANRSGRAACESRWQVILQLSQQLDFVSHGRTQGYRKPSTIRDMVSGSVIRP